MPVFWERRWLLSEVGPASQNRFSSKCRNFGSPLNPTPARAGQDENEVCLEFPGAWVSQSEPSKPPCIVGGLFHPRALRRVVPGGASPKSSSSTSSWTPFGRQGSGAQRRPGAQLLGVNGTYPIRRPETGPANIKVLTNTGFRLLGGHDEHLVTTTLLWF